MTSLWRNVIVNVVANSNWSCLLISAPKVHWRVQPTAARRSGRFNNMHGTLHALHVSQQCHHENCPQMIQRNNGHLITLQIWMEWRYRVWEATHEAILKRLLEAQNSFWIKLLKVALEKIWDNFPQVQSIKLFWILQLVWQEYVNGDGRHSKYLSVLKKCSHLQRLCCLE